MEILTAEETRKLFGRMFEELAQLRLLVEDLRNESAAKDIPDKPLLSMGDVADVFGMSIDGFRSAVTNGFIKLNFFIPETNSRKLMLYRTELLAYIKEHFGSVGRLTVKSKLKKEFGRVPDKVRFVRLHEQLKYSFCLKKEIDQLRNAS